MRNIFNQFQQPENRLTHAFACCLHHDKKLLKNFLIDLLNLSPPSINCLSIIEQSLPGRFGNGSEQSSVETGQENGLPDMIVFDEEGWCVIIESKITSPICKDQIKRHIATLKRRGYSNPHLAVIAIKKPHDPIPNCTVCTWSSIYKWISQFGHASFWAEELREYFEILEKTMTNAKQLTTGTITDFIGIPFDKRTPFSYLEGKRILKLMMERLKERKQFDPKLQVDYESGRGAITNHATVWDILSLKTGRKSTNFTDTPHLTFGFTETQLQIMLTLPDKVIKTKIPSLKDVKGALSNFVGALDQLKVSDDICTPRMKLEQRHSTHRRSNPIIDGILEFDLRTLALTRDDNHKIKRQGEWLDSLYGLCQAKKSTMQLQIGVFWSYTYLSKISSEQILELVENSCNAMVELVSLIKTDQKNTR